jgi:hypothetical protein
VMRPAADDNVGTMVLELEQFLGVPAPGPGGRLRS